MPGVAGAAALASGPQPPPRAERDDPQKPAVTNTWFREALLGQRALASGAADT